MSAVEGTAKPVDGVMRASFHLAQVNVARVRGEMTDPVMAEFVARLPDINALADQSPGFVWRLQTEDGDATAVRPYEDARILINLSVWTDLRALRAYVYGSAHAAVKRRRREWFERSDRRSSPRPSGATRTYCVRLQLRRAVRARRPSDAT